MAEQHNWLLAIALHKLTLARCYKFLNNPQQAQDFFNQAVIDIRELGSLMDFPIFLIERTKFHLQQTNWADAKRDINEAEGIIKRGDMKLYAVDWHLAMSHYQLTMDNKKAAIEHQYTAKQLIKVTGYKLREKALNPVLLK